MAHGHSFETDAQGNLVGVPTNLKVDSAGNVFDGAGNYVGKAGEVYVDTDGNAVNAAGQIVGHATTGVRAAVSAPVPNLAEQAATVVSNSEFYRKADGEVLQVPTNLTVGSDGLVRDANGNVVGKRGEVFVDAHGNAINSAGQVVGTATQALTPIIEAHTNNLQTRTDDVQLDSAIGQMAEVTPELPPQTFYPSGETMPSLTDNSAEFVDDGSQFAGRSFGIGATEGLVPDAIADAGYDTQPDYARDAGYGTDFGSVPNPAVSSDYVADASYPAAPVAPRPHLVRHVVSGETVPTNLFVDDGGNVLDAAGNYLGRAGEIVADSSGNVINAAGQVVGSITGPVSHGDHTYDQQPAAYPDPRNKYLDGIDGVAQNRYGDGVYGDGRTFASRAFGQNLDTDMLDRDTPDRPLGFLGHNDLGTDGLPHAGEPGYPAAANRWQHRVMHRVSGKSVATNLTVDAEGNVHDAAGNFVGKAGEVVAEPDGTVVNAARQVVGRAVQEPDLAVDSYGEPDQLDDYTTNPMP